MTKPRGKAGRPKKSSGAPTAHHPPSRRIKDAIAAMVEDGLSVKDAAEKAGLTYQALYIAIKREPVRQLYMAEVRALQTFAKHVAVRTLIRVMESDNAAAAVAAARTVLTDDARPEPPAGMARTPGFSFLIIDNRGAPAGQALPNGHAAPMIEHLGNDYDEQDNITAPQ